MLYILSGFVKEFKKYVVELLRNIQRSSEHSYEN